MVKCLPEPGALSASLFAAPVLLVRGLRRRAAHWIVIHHQRYLQKLSVRRRRHQSLGNRSPRPCSEPLVGRNPHRLDGKIRPLSEPSLPSSQLEGSGEETHGTDEVELEVHVSVIHVPVQPLLVLSRSFSWARALPLPPTHTLPEFDDQDQSRQPEAAAIFPKKPPPLLPQKPAGRNDPNLRQPSASGSPSQIARNRPPKAKGPHALPVNGSQLNLMTSHQESQPYVTLDDGKRILITPLYQKIMDKPYFHFISRDKAKTLMMQGDDGMFLIRPSTHSGEQLTLALRANNKTYNVSIRQRPDGLFALGSEKTLEKVFSSIDELTSTHKRDPIKLENGKLAFLIHTPPKKGSIYVKHYPPGLGKK